MSFNIIFVCDWLLSLSTVKILNLHEHKSTTEMSLEFVNEVIDKTIDGIKIDHKISLNVSKASFLILKIFSQWGVALLQHGIFQTGYTRKVRQIKATTRDLFYQLRGRNGETGDVIWHGHLLFDLGKQDLFLLIDRSGYFLATSCILCPIWIF